MICNKTAARLAESLARTNYAETRKIDKSPKVMANSLFFRNTVMSELNRLADASDSCIETIRARYWDAYDDVYQGEN